MKSSIKRPSTWFLTGALLAISAAPATAAGKEARVTQVVREVNLLPANAKPQPAALNDRVSEGIAVRTGDRSRSELTFPDVTITRLGANTIFTFDRGGHGVDLSGGSVLLRVPKNSGGGNVRTNAVSVAITGTTLIMESSRGGRSKLIMLEGSGRASLRKYRSPSRDVRAGQMLDVPAGAKTLPMPQDIDLNQVMQDHPLVTGFRPLPSRDLILAETRKPRRPGPDDEPIYEGRPVDGEPPRRGPVISVGGSFGLPGLSGGSRRPGRGGRRGDDRDRGQKQPPPPTRKPTPAQDSGPR